VHVIKLIDFIAKIPEQLDLNFLNFSTNFYAFLKFTGLKPRVFMCFCIETPRKIEIIYRYAPGLTYPRGIRSIPARSVVVGDGEVGEKGHSSLANLWVVEAWLGVVGGGGSMAEQRWRRGFADSSDLC
jgi:hypothetical protein